VISAGRTERVPEPKLDWFRAVALAYINCGRTVGIAVTLVLANANLIGVNVVSERLLSRRIAGGTEPFDLEANKNVVFVARDGVVVIGYSGPAYIGPKTTDQWIANVCCGESATSTTRHEGASPAPPPEWLHIGILARRLRDGSRTRFRNVLLEFLSKSFSQAFSRVPGPNGGAPS